MYRVVQCVEAADVKKKAKKKATKKGAREGGSNSKQKLLRAAIELICDHGAAGSSVDRICERAGVVKSALYWHFGNKEGLLLAVIDEVSRVCIREVFDSIYETEDPMERLDRMLSSLRHIVEHESALLQVVPVMVSERGNLSEKITESVRILNKESHALIAHGFEETLKQNVESVDLLAHTIVSLTYGALREQQIDPEGADIDRFFQDMREVVLSILFKRIGFEAA
jgi:TetR/AcrR family acrAB operon transcriptional repressor